jgi:phage terminase large subunit
LKVRLEAANNDVSLGLQAVDKQLRGAMPISPRCQGLINEIPSYTWQPQKGGGFKEQPVNINDDACDALRYAVMALEPDPKNPWAALTNAGGVA